jgi:hypothetical protein
VVSWRPWRDGGRRGRTYRDPTGINRPLGAWLSFCHHFSQIEVEPEPGYCEPTNLHICAVMESGARKTAALDALAAPLRKWGKQPRPSEQTERKRTYSLRKTLEAENREIAEASGKRR